MNFLGLCHLATSPKYALVHSFWLQNITCFFSFFRAWIIGVWNLGPTKNALVNSFSRCCLEEAGNASGLPSARFTMCLHFLNWLWSVLRKVFGVFGQTCLYCGCHYVHAFFVILSHTSTSLCYISLFSWRDNLVGQLTRVIQSLLTWPVLLCVVCKWLIKYGLTTGNPVGLEVNICPRSLSSRSAKST